MGKLGKDKCFDIYCESDDEEKRFLLGNEGRKKLFVVGLNPSTANQCRSDKTIDSVKAVLKLKGKEFDGFVMTNLYPLRCPKPDKLPENPDRALMSRNIKRVFDYAKKEDSLLFWAAWGDDIEKRHYFADALEEFIKRASENVQWKHFGPLTNNGHPRHASLRGSTIHYGDAVKDWKFQEFDAYEYVKKLGEKRSVRQHRNS